MSPPDLSRPLDDRELIDAITWYAARASLVNPSGSNRRVLRKLLQQYDLTVARLLQQVAG